MSKKISVRQRVWSLLCAGLENYENDHKWFYFLGADGCQYDIQMHDGFIPQSHFANPHVVGSTEGKRRFRELRREMGDKYRFQVRKIGDLWGYRIRRIEEPAQVRMQMVREESHVC